MVYDGHMAEHIFVHQTDKGYTEIIDGGSFILVIVAEGGQGFNEAQLPELEVAKLHVALGVWLDQRELDRTLKPYEGKHRSETAA